MRLSYEEFRAAALRADSEGPDFRLGEQGHPLMTLYRFIQEADALKPAVYLTDANVDRRAELLELASRLVVANEQNANPLRFGQMVADGLLPEEAAEVERGILSVEAMHWVGQAAAIIAEVDRVSREAKA